MSDHVERYSHISVTQNGEDRATVEVAHIEISEGFDPDTCCDEREKALIAMLRRYLRPEQAPDCLVQRLRHVMADACSEPQLRDKDDVISERD
ncbi:hypothetical protein [Bifidobacterium crudilactis]|jgi:hypothetical protein|uniref:hypothetical protein n=1 Tax=Bifidobacterium crudilactis TaxID=327277 RepID=UPI000A5C3AFE|nr:hypothetical protein [Bifidobacterium crudilactis]MCI1663452.1 hypothetical protein [Bifidobacterium crudilactis]MCI1867552.1 hypothetical protein [Bifidobacterium crudilactis]MCI2149194.1 hypothetical protein [Bifidobacterium crudilactis]MCI2157956.1 hypothetical protein [Bifidobacterium crudilactis]